MHDDKTTFINGSIKKLSATCVTSKLVGETVLLKCTVTSGAPPFTITFFKNGTQVAQRTATLNEEIIEDDATYSVGTVVYLTTVVDSCADPGPQTASESCTVQIVSVPTTGSISFASTPSGADIYLDNILQTPKTPATITDIPAGSHTYLLRLSGYNDATGNVTVVAGQTATVSVTLTPVVTTGSISFASTPSGASIYLDGVQTGTTPRTITNIPAGSHTYLLRLSGYNDATGTVTVTAGQTATVSVTLTPVVTTGSISFASTPSGADIYLDNVLQTPKTPATITNVSAGSHLYRLRLSGYNDATGTVTVTAGQTTTVSVTLNNFGSISFSSVPSGADIYLDGTLIGLTPATVTNVPAGNHSYLLRRSGYADASGTVTVTAGQTATVSVTLTTFGSISFTSIPFALIYLDGELQGITPQVVENVPAGSHTYTLTSNGYADATGTVTVTAGQTAIVSVTLCVLINFTLTCSSTVEPGGRVDICDTATSGIPPFRRVYLRNGTWIGENQNVPLNSPGCFYDYPTTEQVITYSVEYSDSCTNPSSQVITKSCIVTVAVSTYNGWVVSKGELTGNLSAIGEIIDGYLGMADLGFAVSLGNVGTTIDYYLGL